MAGIIILISHIEITDNMMPSSFAVKFRKINIKAFPFTPKSIKGTEGNMVWIINIVETEENNKLKGKLTPKNSKIIAYWHT